MGTTQPERDMPVDFPEIKRRREALGLTMEEAARRAGHQGARARIWWSDVEGGVGSPDPRISTLEAVAAALGCRVDDLLAPGPVKPIGVKPAAKAPRGSPPKRQKRSSPSGSAGSKG